jgi:hypothetical protein
MTRPASREERIALHDMLQAAEARSEMRSFVNGLLGLRGGRTVIVGTPNPCGSSHWETAVLKLSKPRARKGSK